MDVPFSSLNFTYQLSREGKRIAGFKLEDEVPVERLVTIDPVPLIFFKQTRGAVQTNVGHYYNYYQRRPGVSMLRRVDSTTGNLKHPLNDPANFVEIGSLGSDVLRGFSRTSDAPDSQWRVDVDFANVAEARDRVNADDLPGDNRRLLGSDVNHDSMPWWTYERAKTHLS